MIEFPHIEPGIESLLKGDTVHVAFSDAAQLQIQQLVDGLLVPSDDFGLWQTLHAVPKRGVAEIFEKQEAIAFPLAVKLRHFGVYLFEKAVHVDEWQFARPLFEDRQLFAGKGQRATLGQFHYNEGWRWIGAA